MSSAKPKILDFPPHLPTSDTRLQVQVMVGCGLAPDEVAAVLRCTPLEVKRLYVEELRYGLAMCTQVVGKAVYDRAAQGEIKAATLWLRARAGWRDQAVAPAGVENATDEQRAKSALVDRILGMLTPEQLAAAVKSDAAPMLADRPAGSALN